jgi:hypothetical protein
MTTAKLIQSGADRMGEAIAERVCTKKWGTLDFEPVLLAIHGRMRRSRE